LKVVLLADTHYGARSDNDLLCQYQKKFFDKVLYKYIDKFKPEAFIHLGDLVDNRRVVNYKTLTTMREDFLYPMEYFDMEKHWLVGNHDAFYKNTLKLNAVNKFVTTGTVHNKATEVMLGDCKVLMVPWICDENREETFKLINDTDAQYCFGHLELNGFEIRKGSISKHGDDRKLFSKFKSVFSGHFHNRSSGNNIRYIGSAFQFDWSDYNEWKGFSVFDTETGEIKSYRNPFTFFNVLEYDEDNPPPLDAVKDTYVRVYVKNKTSESKLNDYISQINNLGVIEVTIIDNSIQKILLKDDKIVIDEVKVVCDSYIGDLILQDSVKKNVTDMFENIYKVSIDKV
jgi:DNA repair exonuclease SbcCD nuclease subunit